MTYSVNKGRAADVMDAAIDNLSHASYVVDLISSEPALGRESISKPFLGEMTVNDGFASAASGEVVSADALVISIAQEKWLNLQYDARQAAQDLKGNYPKELGRHAVIKIRTEQDKDLLDHLAFGVAGASDTFNAAADSLASSDIRSAMASLASEPGVDQRRMLIVASPFQASRLKDLAGNYSGGVAIDLNAGGLGVANAGLFDGVPMVQTQGLPGVSSQKGIAFTAISTDSTNTTYTVAAGHGISSGMPMSASVGTLQTGSVVSVGATSVVVAGSGSNQTVNGTLYLNAEVGLVLDRDGVFFIPEFNVDVKEASTANTFGDLLKVGSLYGRGAHAGRVKRFLSPRGAL